jgi:hypothetical protein
LNKILEGRIDFYSIFEKLVNDIIDAGGLEVTLLIYKVFYLFYALFLIIN